MLGFPKDDDTIGGLFGVNEEDRHAWAKERQMRLERHWRRKQPMAAYEIAAAGITSQMRAAYIEEARGTMAKETTTTTRSQSRNIDPELEEIRREAPSGGYEFGG